MLESSPRHHRVGREKFVLVVFFGSLHDCAPVGPPRDRSLCFDCQTVQRHVRRLEIECTDKVAFPGTLEMTWQREDQVERDIGDAAAPKRSNGLTYLRRVVRPVHPFQRRLIEALRAK